LFAHNSHIGDARYTGMGMDREELNLGQLYKERWGSAVSLIGLGTHSGTVTCTHEWDEPFQVKHVNASRHDSYERMAHDTAIPTFALDLREGKLDVSLREALMHPHLERFIGVIYRPETERWSHYSEAILPMQFDAYVWFDITTAVEPLETEESEGPDESHPFGV